MKPPLSRCSQSTLGEILPTVQPCQFLNTHYFAWSPGLGIIRSARIRWREWKESLASHVLQQARKTLDRSKLEWPWWPTLVGASDGPHSVIPLAIGEKLQILQKCGKGEVAWDLRGKKDKPMCELTSTAQT